MPETTLTCPACGRTGTVTRELRQSSPPHALILLMTCLDPGACEECRETLARHGYAVLFTKTHGRILAPGLTALDPALPDDLAKRSPLATAWRTLDRELDHFITNGLAAA